MRRLFEGGVYSGAASIRVNTVNIFLTIMEFAPHPGGTNDHEDHACEPNNITVQNKIIAKILPVNKFTTLKFLSLLPSMNGYFFS